MSEYELFYGSTLEESTSLVPDDIMPLVARCGRGLGAQEDLSRTLLALYMWSQYHAKSSWKLLDSVSDQRYQRERNPSLSGIREGKPHGGVSSDEKMEDHPWGKAWFLRQAELFLEKGSEESLVETLVKLRMWADLYSLNWNKATAEAVRDALEINATL